MPLNIPVNREVPQPARRKQAAALRYDQDNDPVPRVVAKGSGEMAERIIQLAHEHGIDVYEDPDLIELLSKLEVHELIPQKLFLAVAEVMAYVYRLNHRVDEVRRQAARAR